MCDKLKLVIQLLYAQKYHTKYIQNTHIFCFYRFVNVLLMYSSQLRIGVIGNIFFMNQVGFKSGLAN